jgi:hypothetical protein
VASSEHNRFRCGQISRAPNAMMKPLGIRLCGSLLSRRFEPDA